MERFLFYLPVVTPWWFETIIKPMIRTLVPAAEVHVLVPPLWRNTGIGPEQLAGCAEFSAVRWHVADGDAHPSLRTSPADPDEIVELARSIDPAYVLCRSADIETPRRFPGKVRHLMEAGASPFSTRSGSLILQQEFWHHGAMPDLADDDREAIERAFAKPWKRMRNRADSKKAFRLSRARALQAMGLPDGRRIIALPLQYEHPESFFGMHNRFERNLDLIHYAAGHVDDDFVIAVTDHPLNYEYVDNSEVHDAIRSHGSRMHLVPNASHSYFTTDLLIKHCDGLIVQNSKAIYSGAFFGKPMLRLSHRPSADWLGVHDDPDALMADVRSGKGGPTEDQARLWFGYHVLHEVFEAASISAEEIVDRIDRPFSRERLVEGLARHEALPAGLDLAA